MTLPPSIHSVAAGGERHSRARAGPHQQKESADSQDQVNTLCSVGPGPIHRGLLNSARLLILDEADELLSGGFQKKIEEIYSMLPERLQVVIVSATMPSMVRLCFFPRLCIRVLAHSLCS